MVAKEEIVTVLVNAVQELSAKNDVLVAENVAIKERLAALDS